MERKKVDSGVNLLADMHISFTKVRVLYKDSKKYFSLEEEKLKDEFSDSLIRKVLTNSTHEGVVKKIVERYFSKESLPPAKAGKYNQKFIKYPVIPVKTGIQLIIRMDSRSGRE